MNKKKYIYVWDTFNDMQFGRQSLTFFWVVFGEYVVHEKNRNADDKQLSRVHNYYYYSKHIGIFVKIKPIHRNMYTLYYNESFI